MDKSRSEKNEKIITERPKTSAKDISRHSNSESPIRTPTNSVRSEDQQRSPLSATSNTVTSPTPLHPPLSGMSSFQNPFMPGFTSSYPLFGPNHFNGLSSFPTNNNPFLSNSNPYPPSLLQAMASSGFMQSKPPNQFPSNQSSFGSSSPNPFSSIFSPTNALASFNSYQNWLALAVASVAPTLPFAANLASGRLDVPPNLTNSPSTTPFSLTNNFYRPLNKNSFTESITSTMTTATQPSLLSSSVSSRPQAVMNPTLPGTSGALRHNHSSRFQPYLSNYFGLPPVYPARQRKISECQQNISDSRMNNDSDSSEAAHTPADNVRSSPQQPSATRDIQNIENLVSGLDQKHSFTAEQLAGRS